MAAVRRTLKNVTKNYAPCERDVRDATSNDQSLPSPTTMARITNATYDVIESPLVMAMVWKRLNDTGKNWRHVYKTLLVMDYLLKTGAEHVIQEVVANKFAVQCLLDFMHVGSNGVDKGINVRQQAQKLLNLIDDDAGLRAHRKQCLQNHKRMTEAMGSKAQPKRSQQSRVSKFNNKQNVMPNGEVAPNLAQQNLEAIRHAQIESYQEYATSTAGQQAVIQQQHEYAMEQERRSSGNNQTPPPNSPPPQNMTEDEALAYALRISALESGQSSNPMSPNDVVTYSPSSQRSSNTSNPFPQPPQYSTETQQQQQHNTSQNEQHRGLTQEEIEEEELAMALSLSLAESQQAARRVLDSDDESDADEDTPPSTPYQGDFFEGVEGVFEHTAASELSIGDGANELPSYDDSLLETSDLPNTSHHDDAHYMQDYLTSNDEVGATQTIVDYDEDAYFDPASQPGYMEVVPPNQSSLSGRSSTETTDDEEL